MSRLLSCFLRVVRATRKGSFSIRKHFTGDVSDGGKPAPDPFLTAAKYLGVSPGLCLALEDSFNGVRSASTAGMMAFIVPDLLDPTLEIRSLCTGVVGDFHEVRTLILRASAA